MTRNKRRPGQPRSSTWVPMAPAVPQTHPDRIAALTAQFGEEAVQAQLAQSTKEMWMNNRYTVSVTRRDDGSVEELSIRRNDRKPVRDWRDFQRIKNELAGPESEAVELYPAMSRIMDTANQFFLWCIPPGSRFPLGYDLNGPHLLDQDDGSTGAVQRDIPADWKLPG